MKFSRTLDFNRVPEWTQSYIDYHELSRIVEQLKAWASSEGSVGKEGTDVVPDGQGALLEAAFEKMFRGEVDKVSEFFHRQYEHIKSLMHESVLRGGDGQGHGQGGRRSSFDSASSNELPKDLDVLQGAYVSLHDLRAFLQLNHTGFLKMIHKHDKHSIVRKVEGTLTDLVEDKLPQEMVGELNEWIKQVERQYAVISGGVLGGDASTARTQLKAILRERIVMERCNVWQEMVAMERRVNAVNIVEPEEVESILGKPSADTNNVASHAVKLGAVIKMSVILIGFAVLLLVNIFESVYMNKALALSFLIVSLWATEGMPLFATSMLCPLLIIVMGILRDSSGVLMTSKDATKAVLTKMFGDVVIMLLGGFAISAAATKYGLAKQVACKVISIAGKRNGLLIFAIMILTLFMSALISNVAAPVLSFSILTPLLRSLPTEGGLAKQLVFAVAIAANVGGMISPISSPQNVVSFGQLVERTGALSWFSWFAISLPCCLACLALCWVVLIFYFPKSKPINSNVAAFTNTPLRWSINEIIVVFTTLITVLLWCIEPKVKHLFGSTGVIAFIPLIVFFGTGVLSKDDLASFPWAVVILAMGGSALSLVVENSDLLSHISKMGTSHLPLGPGHSLFIQVFILSLIITIVTCFVSHTVGAMIFVPLVLEFAIPMGSYPARVLILAATFGCSAGMAMPVSSFPNIAASSQEDGAGRRYVTSTEFMIVGAICSGFIWLVTFTIGFATMSMFLQ